jgi:putative flippase GtrA
MTIVDAVLARAPARLSSRFVADVIKYGFASAAAFALDFTTLLLLYKGLGVNHLLAASIGFLAGLALVYALSVRYVFNDRRRLAARQEVVGFLATGLAGLAITAGLMHVFVDLACLPVALAKLPTAGFVFFFNFVARRALLFSAAPEKSAP